LVVTDPSAYKGEGADAQDFVISIFRKNPADFPANLQRGTPMLFRDMVVSQLISDSPRDSI
jgi:hypothetical protein